MSGATIAVERWISPEEADGRDPVGGIGGWFNWESKGMRWKDYVATWRVPAYAEALRKEIVEKGIRRGGDWHQNDEEGTPLFSDGKVGSFTYRAWGDLLAAIWSEEEGNDYTYMDFYLDHE